MEDKSYLELETQVDKLLANIGCENLKTLEDLASWEGDRSIMSDFGGSPSFINNRLFIDKNNHAVNDYTEEEWFAMKDDPREYYHEDLVDDLAHIISLLAYLYDEIKTETEAKNMAFDMIRGIVNEVHD
jgi:hypothetical protein